jgi:hypothetical protein
MRHVRTRALAAAAWLTIVLVACESTTTRTPDPSTGPTRTTLGPTPTIAGPTPTATVEPTPVPFPDFASLDVTSTKQWSSGEIFLLGGFRGDGSAYDRLAECRPRRDDLPEGATDGVECAVDGGAAERVGAYLFPDDATARRAYDTRLGAYGLDPDADGGCPFGTREAGEPGEPRPVAACFQNEFGIANLRVYWPGQSVVVGALGRDGSIDKLGDWARRSADGSIDVWTGGAGAPRAFTACESPVKPQRVQGSATLSYPGGGGIVMTDPAGKDVRRVPVGGRASEWSPDGTRIAYEAIRDDGSSDLRLYDVERDERRRLGSYESAAWDDTGTPEIRWSPDGRWIGVTEWRPVTVRQEEVAYDPEVLLFDAATGDRVDASAGVLLDWSPDSSRLLVRRVDDHINYPRPTRGRITVVHLADGSAGTVGRGVNAAWSGDCRFVSVDQGWEVPGTTVFDGVGRRPRMAANTSGSDWSSAGAELALSIGGRLMRWSMDDAEPQVIGKGGGPLWSDDATHLAFGTDAGLMVADRDGHDVHVVASPKYPLAKLSWSPDGRYLVSTHEPNTDTCGPATWGYVIATDGSGVRELPVSDHIRWRPTDPTPAEGPVPTDPPPVRGEGCGG